MVADEHGRTPFQHPSLAGLDNFNAERPQNVVDVEKLARFAVDIGLDKVLRWKPRLVSVPGRASASASARPGQLTSFRSRKTSRGRASMLF